MLAEVRHKWKLVTGAPIMMHNLQKIRIVFQNSTSYLILVPNKCKANGNAMQIRFETTSPVHTVHVMPIAVLATVTCGHFIDTKPFR